MPGSNSVPLLGVRTLLDFVSKAILSILLFAMTLPDHAFSMDIAADDHRISYEGRVMVGASHEVMMGFPGITISMRVNASRLRARISASSDDVYFDAVVDMGPPERLRLKKGANELLLFEHPEAAIHSIKLVRRTESWEGVCQVLGYDLGSGKLLEPDPLSSRKLMFIGDSVTCGAGTEESDVPGKPGAERSNAAASFGMKLASRLGSRVHLVSYGGRGIIRDWQGIRNTNNAPAFYELGLPDDPKSRWEHASYVPDAIGICLGTNDFSQGIPDQNEFVNAFVEFIRKVQRDAPKAVIFLIDSPILNDGVGEPPKLSACRAYLDEIIRKVDSPLVTHVVIRHYKGSPGDGHPTAAEHARIADELEPIFRSALHWQAQ